MAKKAKATKKTAAKKKTTKKAAAKTTKKAAKKSKAKTTKKAAPKKVAKKTTKKAAAKKATTKKASTTKTASKKASGASAAKKTTAKKATTAKSTAPKKKRQPNLAFMKPLTPSPELSQVIGASPMPRTQVIQKLWEYIKKNKLQDENNRRMIIADEKLRPVFGKDSVSMFEMTKVVNQHLK